MEGCINVVYTPQVMLSSGLTDFSKYSRLEQQCCVELREDMSSRMMLLEAAMCISAMKLQISKKPTVNIILGEVMCADCKRQTVYNIEEIVPLIH